MSVMAAPFMLWSNRRPTTGTWKTSAPAILFVLVRCYFFFFSSRRRHTRFLNVTGQTCALPIFMLFTLAALGLPGTSGFIGEFLILMGDFQDNFLVAVIASLGVILGAAYMLWLYKRVVFGKLVNNDLNKLTDLDKSEYFILISLALPTLFFGFYPEPLFNTIEVSVNDLIEMYNSNLINK